MSIHTFDQVQINGSLKNANGDDIDLSSLVVSEDLSDYALKTDLNTALEDYTATADLGDVVSSAVSLELASYPSQQSLQNVSNRFVIRENQQTEDASSTIIQSLDLNNDGTALHFFDITVLAKSTLENIDQDETFSCKMCLAVNRNNSNGQFSLTIVNGEKMEYRMGAVGWSVDAAMNVSSLEISVSGEESKKINWSLFMTHDYVQAQPVA